MSTDTRLWCLHHIGLDDVHPAPDFATAQKWADWANAAFAEHAEISRFVVAIWPWDADSHADGLAASIAGWTLPTPDAVNADKAVAGEQDTVAFVQEWMMSGDHEPDQWHRDFAAAIDARATPAPDKALMPEAAVGAKSAPAELADLIDWFQQQDEASTPTPVEEPVSCSYCDGTGDVHRADGEWLGTCGCFTAATNAGQVEAISALTKGSFIMSEPGGTPSFPRARKLVIGFEHPDDAHDAHAAVAAAVRSARVAALKANGDAS